MKNQSQNPTVHLQVFKGAKITRDEDGNIAVPFEKFKIQHGGIEWENFKKTITNLGFGRFKILSVTDFSGKTPKEVDSSAIEKELTAVFGIEKPSKSEVESSDKDELIKKQQAAIEAMEARLKALEGKNTEELSNKRTEYVALTGKAAHDAWTVEDIEKAIEAHKTANPQK